MNESLILLSLWVFIFGVVVTGASTIMVSYGNWSDCRGGSPLARLYEDDHAEVLSIGGFVFVILCSAFVDINFLGGS